MINSFIGSIMNMTAEIYIQQNTQADSGNVTRQWVYDKTLDCKIEPIKSGGALGRSDNKTFDYGSDNSYQERFQLKMKSPEPLSRRWRVSGIKDISGNSIYKEIDRYGQPDMIFDVTASHAELDPFGKISYYETTIQRVMVQQNDSNSGS
jgi:hypothetical protein